MPLKTLAGCYTALITPFTADASALDLSRFTEQINYQAKGGVAGIVPCGTTGESPTLSDFEWEQVVAHAIEIGRKKNLAVIAGTGSNNTAHAVELQRRAHQLGADAGLSVNPYYNKPTQDGLYHHFMTIADAAELPVVLYNIPGRSAVALQPETIARLAKHPNIIAVKEATGSIDSASAIIAACNEAGAEITIVSGDDTLTLPYASVGGRGVISVISNILPARVQALCDAFLSECHWPKARTIHYQLLPLARGLLSLATNPIPVKTAMKILNRDAGSMRLPMCSIENERTLQKIGSLLSSAGLQSSNDPESHLAGD